MIVSELLLNEVFVMIQSFPHPTEIAVQESCTVKNSDHLSVMYIDG